MGRAAARARPYLCLSPVIMPLGTIETGLMRGNIS